MPDQVGQEPTGAQRAVIEAAKGLSPDKSLERIDGLARFVFANVAVVGTLLTGLGLLPASAASVGGSLFTAIAVLVALSLLLALGATAPRLAWMRSSDLVAVERWYRRQIVRRGTLAIASAAALAAAVSLAAIFALTHGRRTLSVTAQATRGTDGSTVVRLTVADVPDGRSISADIGTRSRTGGTFVPVCTLGTRARAANPLILECPVEGAGQRLTVVARVIEAGNGQAAREYSVEVH
jgi:hypothetical protein